MTDDVAPAQPDAAPYPVGAGEVPGLLGAGRLRELAAAAGVRPAKSLGQNFVVDGGTVRRIVRAAGVVPGTRVLEVGPGLGSLTLCLLAAGADVVAVEIDPALAAMLPATVAAQAPGWVAQGGSARDGDGRLRLSVVTADALEVTAAGLPRFGEPASGPVASDAAGPKVVGPQSFVANLPYNVAVPVLLHVLATFDGVRDGLVMVQAEVADRLVAAPGSRVYGVPSVKAAWYARARRVATVGRTVFWPVPNVDSALVRFDRRSPPATSASRDQVFAVVDAAFAQRRKTLRAALATLAGSPDAAAAALTTAGIDPATRGERLDVADFARLAEHLPAARHRR